MKLAQVYVRRILVPNAWNAIQDYYYQQEIGQSRQLKCKWRQEESVLMPTVNYLRTTDCEHEAVNKNESYRKATEVAKGSLWKSAYMPTINNPSKMTNSTGTDGSHWRCIAQ